MRLWIKICGLSNAESVAAAVEAGADAVGFVFAVSVRRVTPGQARRLAEAVPAGMERVAVMRHPDPAQWRQVWDQFHPSRLQTEAEDFAALQLSPDCMRLPVYRDSVLRRRGVPPAWPPRILFEGGDSGTGQPADWALAAQVAAQTELVLAGGLSADNVAEAVRSVRPFGVDVSSGVESHPGVKDPEQIFRFVAAARMAEKEL